MGVRRFGVFCMVAVVVSSVVDMVEVREWFDGEEIWWSSLCGEPQTIFDPDLWS